MRLIRNEGYTLRVDAEQLKREADVACLGVLLLLLLLLMVTTMMTMKNIMIVMMMIVLLPL